MKSEGSQGIPGKPSPGEKSSGGKAKAILDTRIADSIDMLVEYLVDNSVRGIHPFIMGEVEKRLIIKVLERSRGNKLQAAKWLGMSRNTFHKKVQKLMEQDMPSIRNARD
jgi:DNA-binding protein Fis